MLALEEKMIYFLKSFNRKNVKVILESIAKEKQNDFGNAEDVKEISSILSCMESKTLLHQQFVYGWK